MAETGDETEVICGAEAIGKYLGVSSRKVRHLIQHSGLPVFRMGARDITIRKNSLRAWLADREAKAREARS